MPESTCVCGAIFEPRLNSQRYCSKPCQVRSSSKKRSDKFPCSRCGCPMWDPQPKATRSPLVCQPCRRIAPQRRPESRPVPAPAPLRAVECPCGARLETRHPTRRFCSRACGRMFTNQTRSERASNRASRSGPEWKGWSALRLQVLAEESTCWWCDGRFQGRWPDPLSATVDHIIPVSKGGLRVDRSNVRAAHRQCNMERGNRVPPAAVLALVGM